MPRELADLGSPPCFTIERRVRATFLVRWEYDGHSIGYDSETDSVDYDPERREKVRSFFSELAAYKWLARRMIFARRDKFTLGTPPAGKAFGNQCALCDTEPTPHYSDEGPGQCRYHDGQSFQRLTDRLARWLRWRDRRRAELGRTEHAA